MASLLFQTIDQLAREKGIDPQIIVGAVEDAMLVATRKYYKTEFWHPKVSDRHNFEEWDMMGQTTMGQRVVARAQEILATHKPSPIKPETERVIQQVLEAAEERVKNKG